jgi:hypothetical protein
MYDVLKKFSRDVSLERFQSHSTNQSVQLRESIAGDDALENQWSCGVLWGNDQVKGLIRLRFTTLNVLALGASVFAHTNDDELFTFTKDFMKEYCNLYAGFIKGTFNNAEIPISISLPILSDSFTIEACLGTKPPEDLTDQWTLFTKESHFVVQSFIKIEDNFKAHDFNFLKNKETKKKSTIEFF